jgi:5'(3')-deoxyribonucleotidase
MMTGKKKIGIDLDSTLNDLDVKWSAWIAATIDPTFTRDRMVNWEMENNVAPPNNHVYDFLWMRNTFLTLDPRPFAQRVVGDLAAAGHELFVVTATHPAVMLDKWEWVRRHFGVWFDHKHFLPVSKKGLLSGLDVLIDDGLHNLLDFPNRGVLLDAPWNRPPKNGAYLFDRAADWLDVRRILFEGNN